MHALDAACSWLDSGPPSNHGRCAFASSRLITRIIAPLFVGLWRSQVARRTLNPGVEGSNPSRPTSTVGSDPLPDPGMSGDPPAFVSPRSSPARSCRLPGCRRTGTPVLSGPLRARRKVVLCLVRPGRPAPVRDAQDVPRGGVWHGVLHVCRLHPYFQPILYVLMRSRHMQFPFHVSQVLLASLRFGCSRQSIAPRYYLRGVRQICHRLSAWHLPASNPVLLAAPPDRRIPLALPCPCRFQVP